MSIIITNIIIIIIIIFNNIYRKWKSGAQNNPCRMEPPLLPRGRFSKDPVTYRARKVILKTMIHSPWKPALLICFR